MPPYEPRKYNSNIKPRTLYILVHNDHCFKLNCNIKSFEQLINDLKTIEKKLDVTAQYPLPKEINVDKVNTIYIDNLNDVVPHIINNNTKEKIVFIFEIILILLVRV